jgi:ABC-type multidrug transport system ATPase subunit
MLELTGLTHTYSNGVRALDDVNLSVAPGMFGLLGPNGAGKSTLMRCVATLQAPSAGAIRFADIDVVREPQRLRRTLGYLPQDFGVYPRVSAYAMLDHLAILKGLTERGPRRAEVERLLQQVNLYEVRGKALAGFSGGMRQRFGIAQALIGGPTLIIVDEPTAGLDPEERNRFLDLLADIADQVVVILSTHIVEDVADLCRNMAVLAGGRIRLQGAPADLVAAMRDRVWRKAVGKADIADLRRRQQVISTRLAGGRTMAHILSESDPGEGFEPHRAGLEEVYFSALSAVDRAA